MIQHSNSIKTKSNSQQIIRGEKWQHPLHEDIRVPRKIAAAIALFQTGITTYVTIAKAVGLSVDEVEYIDAAQEHSIRQLAIVGIPQGDYFRLRQKVRCPKCNSWITLAPCVACNFCP